MDFAPPTTGLYPGQEDKPSEAAPVVDDGRPLTAQQRLAALKAKLSDARKTNHKAVVEEDRRSKLGPQGLKDEAKHKKYDQIKKEGKKETDSQKMMSTTAATALAESEKSDKKNRNRGQYGWDVFNNEAQHRHYKKRVRRAEEDGRVGVVRRSRSRSRSRCRPADAPRPPPPRALLPRRHCATQPEPALVRRRTRTPTARTTPTVPRLQCRRRGLAPLEPPPPTLSPSSPHPTPPTPPPPSPPPPPPHPRPPAPHPVYPTNSERARETGEEDPKPTLTLILPPTLPLNLDPDPDPHPD
jgi:hypothetical protein